MFERAGWEVRVASSFVEALECTVEFVPSALLTEANAEGLRTSLTLRSIFSELHTVLITQESIRAGPDPLTSVVHRPVDLEALAANLRQALLASHQPTGPPIGFVILDRRHTILHANGEARRLFEGTFAGEHSASFDALVPLEGQLAWERPDGKWVRLFPESPQPVHWQARRRSWSEHDRTLVALLSDETTGWQHHPLIDLAFNEKAPERHPTRVLFIDAEPLDPLGVATIEAFGGIVEHARTPHEGLRCFEREPGIRCVVVDLETLETKGRDLLLTLRGLRRDVRIVATGRPPITIDPGDELDGMLPKPWGMFRLLNLLSRPAR